MADPYLPAGQDRQDDVEAVLLYCPAAQGVQDVAPAREYWPGIHTVQAVAPEVDEYCPAPQFTQGARPVAEYWPAAHDCAMTVGRAKHMATAAAMNSLRDSEARLAGAEVDTPQGPALHRRRHSHWPRTGTSLDGGRPRR